MEGGAVLRAILACVGLRVSHGEEGGNEREGNEREGGREGSEGDTCFS